MKRGPNDGVESFWKKIRPRDHILQLYKEDTKFLDALERFARDGFKKNEAVIVAATAEHLDALTERFNEPELAGYQATGQYIPLEAEETLSRFMVNNWPSERLLHEAMTPVLTRASRDGRQVRAAGEMVALLWARGRVGATIRLEEIWNDLRKVYRIPLLCAYPRSIFTENAEESIERICATHSKIAPCR